MAKMMVKPMVFFIKLLVVIFTLSSAIVMSAEKVEIEYLANDNVTNQIPLFDNRFIIDADLEEITLIFYRKLGSRPIILVKPDGTKLKVENAIKDGIEWFDDSTFDLIKLEKPMPGPWQAIGNILPKSKIMIVSDITLKVNPMPEVLLEGEIIKVEGEIYNGDSVLNIPDFREVVKLDVDFYSTNKSTYDNFGAEPVKLATFRDDGYELDEYAADGVFTGEFELDFAPGEWLPIYMVKMPMTSRRLEQKAIILRPIPITLSVERSSNESKPHIVSFSISPDYVDPDSILIQGNITYPDKQVEQFSIMDGTGELRTKEIPYTEGGVHRVKINAFGKTIKNREFRLVVPEFSFNVDRAAFVVSETLPSNEELSAQQTKEKANQAAQRVLELEQAQARQVMLAEEEQKQLYLLIGLGNLVVIVFAGLIFFFMKKKKP